MSDDVLVDACELLRRRDPSGKRPGERLEIIARLVDAVVQLRAERDVALKEEQRSAFNVQKAAARISELEAELSNEHTEWLENQEKLDDLEAANDWPLARKQLQAHRSEIRRLRTVIRAGGAAYRLERAAMGIPGGIDHDGQPIAKPEGSAP